MSRKSSLIETINYDPMTRALKVELVGNRKYEYNDVPEEVVTNFRNAESSGRFFRDNIQTKFQAVKVQ